MLIQENFELELAEEVNGDTEQPVVQAISAALTSTFECT